MKLSLAQEKTYLSFASKEAAEQYRGTCLPQKPRRTDSKRIYDNYAFYLSETQEEIWNQDRAEFKIKSKFCHQLNPGDIFKTPKSPEFYWHQFVEFIPQTVLKDHLLIKSLLLPYWIEAETYFAFNFKFLYATNSHGFIIS